METLMLLADTIAMALVLFFSLRNDRLKNGEKQVGIFRYVETVGPEPEKVADPRRNRR